MANNTNWLNISSQSGSSGQTILTLSANKNLSTNYKTAEITAYNPVYNVSAKTYVTLEAYSPYIELSPTLIPVADSGGTFELSISANCSWVIAYPDLVSSYSTTAGTGNRTITFRVPSTTADTTLVGNIVVTDESGQVSRTARIEQYGSGVHIGVFPVELYFDSTGGSQTFTVTADAAYNVSMASGADWARVTPDSGYTGQTTFTVTVNSGYTGDTQRVTTVLIDAPGTGGVVAVYQNKPETRVVVTYNVTSTTDPTQILGNTSSFSKAELADGTEITLGTGYTFPSTGSINVYYTLTGTSLNNFCFSGCTGLTNIFIPETVTSYGAVCFYNTGLQNFAIPDSVTIMGENCFLNNQNLSSVTIGSGVTSLPSWGFASCPNLTEVIVPPTVTSIGQNCFYDSGLETIYFSSSTPPTLRNTALDSGNLQQIIVPCVYVDAYITAWPQYAQYISCQDDTTLYFITDTSNVKGIGETRTITILNTNINPNRTGLNLPSDFPQQGSYTVVGNTIYLTYPRNPSSSATRSWTIGVVGETNDGVSLSGSYKITQNANVTYAIPYTADTSTVDASGETRTITIDTSNLVASSITIGVEGATGVTYTYENGVITVVFPRNNTSGERDIVVTVTGVTVGGTDAVASISYRQDSDEIYLIPYTADTSTVDASGETRYIYIDASNLVASSITISSNGIQGVITSYDSATGIVTVLFPDNTGSEYEIMADTITIEGETTNGHYAVATVEYEQAGVDISTVPLTFAIKTDGYIRWGQTNTVTTPSKTISYNKNEAGWVQIKSDVDPMACPEINVVAGDIIRFKGENDTYGNSYGDAMFQYSTAEYNVYGNILSMVYGDNFQNQSGTGVFRQFFRGEKIHSAKSLILNYGSETAGKYASMFAGCVYLTQTPSLTATILSGGGEYNSMFAGCRSLTQLPTLPAVRLGNGGQFNSMFAGCTGLVTVPSDYLPEIIPEVERPGWTNLTPNCFTGMFRGCTSLKRAPDLPYTGLNDYCYSAMFSGCTSLTTAPALPATTFKSPTAEKMFQGCYQSMFRDCTSLVNPPALPIIEFYREPSNRDPIAATKCYEFMFSGCTSLTEAPVLPASTLTTDCYRFMFVDCSSLSAVTCLATNTASGHTGVTDNWLGKWDGGGVSPYGIFTENPAFGWSHTASSEYNVNGIPPRWEKIDYVPIKYTADTSTAVAVSGETRYIYIDASNLVASSITISVSGEAGITYTFENNVISVDFPTNLGEGKEITVTIAAIDKYGLEVKKDFIFWQRGADVGSGFLTFNIISAANSNAFINWISTTSTTKTIQYRKNGGRWVTQTSSTAGTRIYVATGDIIEFKGKNTTYDTVRFSSYGATFEIEGNIMSLIDSDNFLTATTLESERALRSLFSGCTGLTSAENLTMPATDLSSSCYAYMFNHCTNLIKAPAILPATALTEYCYEYMFSGCTNLTKAPQLPATILSKLCYGGMFRDCSSLVNAPELPATTLSLSCYSDMFRNCTSMNTAPVLNARNMSNYCYTRMFLGCTSLITAPVLPAEILTGYCYNNMFSGCTNLSAITCLATNISAIYPTRAWLDGVAATGTFTTPSTTQWATGVDGIPSGWTRVNSDT